jgi:hypothetical protein
MHKWLVTATLALAVLASAVGMKNLTVNARVHTAPAVTAWGSSPVPIPFEWGSSPVPIPFQK